MVSTSGAIAGSQGKPVLTGAGRYQSLTFDRAGRQLAFLTDRDEYPKQKARFGLYYSDGGQARTVARYDAVGAGMVVAQGGAIQFTKSGDALTFGVGPAPVDSVPADSLAEKAIF